MLLRQTTPSNPACNDNGAFASVRRRPSAMAGILSVAVTTAGPISLDQVSDGVLIIGRAPTQAPAAARRSVH